MKVVNQIQCIKFRAFRAIEDRFSCEKYLEGHKRVLEIYNVAHVSSGKPVWMENPNCYVIIAESLCGDKIYGGARIQVADGFYPLPIEEAIASVDNNIYNYVNSKANEGTGELCGLWNSREVAGMGIGSIFLGRTSISIVSQLGLKSLLALCAPATLRNCLKSGFEIERSLGNKGSFYYPKLDLIATALVMNDPIELPTADLAEREAIGYLRRNPIGIKNEVSLKGNISIEYDLAIFKSRLRQAI